jgi:hypothetical protein
VLIARHEFLRLQQFFILTTIFLLFLTLIVRNFSKVQITTLIMKKIYSLVLSIVGLLFCFSNLNAQPFTGGTFTTLATGGNYSNIATWVGGSKPPLICANCQIIINGNVTIDVTGISLYNTSQLKLLNGADLTVAERFVMKDNSALIVGNTPSAVATLTMQAEADLFTGSFVRLANSNDVVDATFPGPPPASDSLPTGSLGDGIFYISGPNNWDILISNSGYGEPDGTEFMVYTFNCPCFAGLIFGPAISDTVIADATWEFVPAAVLPVVLNRFAAVLTYNQQVELSWATSQEVNSNYFSIQRSSDAVNFSEIGKVKSKGFSSINTDYSFTDPESLNSTWYYRLQMVDQDGKSEYSKIISISPDTKIASVVVFNNPFIDQVRLLVNAADADNLRFTLTDLLGRVCLQQYHAAQKGSNLIDLQFSNAFSAGIYFLNIKSNTINRTLKLIKQ